MADMWICVDCRSANEARAKRCYRCGLPKAQGELTEATAVASPAPVAGPRTVLDAATRVGAKYRPSWPLALLTGGLIFATTTLYVIAVRNAVELARTGVTVGPGQSEATAPAVAFLPVALLSYLAWSFWIALVVANVPALTARMPSRSPVGAFLAQWIPIANLKRPFSVVREVMALLSNGAFGPALLVIAWGVTFVAAVLVPSIYVILRTIGHDDPTVTDSLITSNQIGMYLMIAAAALAAAVLLTVEHEQRRALARRAVVVLEA
jgi:Domain of unknown function (DUF4328)